MDSKRRLVFSILEFLEECGKDGTVKPDDVEGLGIARQCLGEAFGIDPENPDHVAKYSTKPATLLSIFDVFLNAEKKRHSAKPNSPPPGSCAGPTDEQKAEAEKYKSEANAKMPLKEYDAAIELYTKAVNLNPDNAVYYANRAAAYSQSGSHQKAVEDSLKAAQVDPNYSKAYSRLGHAYFCLGRYQESADAFAKGLELDPDNATMKSSLNTALAKAAAGSTPSSSAPVTTGPSPSGVRSGASDSPGGMPDLASMFGGGGAGGGGTPDISAMMQNPTLMRMAQQAMQNPDIMRMAQQMMGSGGAGAGGGPGGAAGGNPLANLMNNPELMNMAQQFMGGMGRGGVGNPSSH